MRLKNIESKYYKILQKLHINLIETRKLLYNPNDYKWVLGTEIIKDIQGGILPEDRLSTTSKSLFGIEIDIDVININNIRLYEDITNKL